MERRVRQAELGVDDELGIESALWLVADHVCDLELSIDFFPGNGDHVRGDICADDLHLCFREHPSRRGLRFRNLYLGLVIWA